MNRPKKITLTLLGIAASVGLYSLIATRPWAVTTGRCWERAAPVASPTPDPFVSCNWGMSGMSVTICSSPAPEKPLREGYRRVKCEKCGQEYDTPGGCQPDPTEEMIKHWHLSHEREASAIEFVTTGYIKETP